MGAALAARGGDAAAGGARDGQRRAPALLPRGQIGDQWHGDGGIRLTAPLSPALHLGAHKILAVSTHYERTRNEADRPAVNGYPPPAQVLGVLIDAIFLDVVDQDVMRMERMNELLSPRCPSPVATGCASWS